MFFQLARIFDYRIFSFSYGNVQRYLDHLITIKIIKLLVFTKAQKYSQLYFKN